MNIPRNILMNIPVQQSILMSIPRSKTIYEYSCMNIPVWTLLCEHPCMFKTTCQWWFFIFHQGSEFYRVTSQDPFSTKSTFEVLIVHCANCCLLRVPSLIVSHWHLTMMTSRVLGGLSFLRWSIRTYFVVLRICAWNDPWIRHGATTFTEVCPGNFDEMVIPGECGAKNHVQCHIYRIDDLYM